LLHSRLILHEQAIFANNSAINTCAPAGRSLVLLGDPQQLEQPQKGSHPEGSEISALAHLLDGRRTIGESQGVFLPETWRLHLAICAFTSELFYEGRLASLHGLERQNIDAPAPFSGAGLWFVPVVHEGNQSYSVEEVERVAGIVEYLTQDGTGWIDRHGDRRPLTRDDILSVAPYNDQVNRLRDRLPGARAGTVDKFQGQEAAVVIYAMTTSSPEDAPRGMEFLYNLNPLQCRHVACALRLHCGQQPTAFLAGMPHAAADGACKRFVPLRGNEPSRGVGCPIRNGGRPLR
jgi:hypothetical protein